MVAALLERYRLLSRSEQRAWKLLSILGMISAGMEAITGGLVYSAISYLTNPGSADYSAITGFIAKRLPGQDAAAKSIAFLALLGAFHVFRVGIQMALSQWHLRLATATSFSLSCRLFDLYLAAPYGFHLTRHSAELQNHVFHNATYILSTLNGGVNLVTQALTIALLLLVVINVSPWTSVATALAIGLVLAVFLHFSRKLQARWTAMQNDLAVAAYRHVQHGFGALKELKVVGREGFFGEMFRKDKYATLDFTIKQHSLGSLPRLLIEAIFGAGVLIAITFGTNGNRGQIVPLLSLYAYVGIRAIPSAVALAHEIGMLRTYVHLTEPVLQDLKNLSGQVPGPAGSREAQGRSVELKAVSFTYAGATSRALDGINLRVNPGEMLGVVGASGAGKTTLGDLVLGLHVPEAGAILVGGHGASLRVQAHIKTGYVPQSVFIVDDTVRRNVALGVKDEAIDEARVLRAVSSARLVAFVAGLPQGLATRLGERGVRCSGGERQRIAIARALYDDPDLIVLDEATSALDPATERDILRSLESFRGHKSLLVISHRLSTVARCDRVIVLRAGRIVAEGTFRELSRTSPDFRAWAGLEPEDQAVAGELL